MDWVKKLGIKHFRGIYSRDGLPRKIKKECRIINLDDIQGTAFNLFLWSEIKDWKIEELVIREPFMLTK